LKARLYQIKAGFAMNRLSFEIRAGALRKRALSRISGQALVLAAALLLAACGGTAEAPLAGAAIGGPFALTSQNGSLVRDSDFKGKWRIVYFGYSFCPDVCPLDLKNIGQALRLLEKRDPALAARVVPIFISVDPERDTPAALKQYVANFHPRLIGLTGTPEAIARVAKLYGVAYAKRPADNGNYFVDHVRATYLMDPDGKPIALLPSDQSGEAVAKEVEKWAK
jgi:protein SCO1/2